MTLDIAVDESRYVGYGRSPGKCPGSTRTITDEDMAETETYATTAAGIIAGRALGPFKLGWVETERDLRLWAMIHNNITCHVAHINIIVIYIAGIDLRRPAENRPCFLLLVQYSIVICLPPSASSHRTQQLLSS